MDGQPIHRRLFRAFLSHAHVDKAVVDHIYTWLSETAEIPIWYDAHNLPASATISTELADAITQCRNMLIVLSQASVKSGWVKDVDLLGIIHRITFPYRRRVLNSELPK